MAPKGKPPRQLLLPHLCLPSWAGGSIGTSQCRSRNERCVTHICSYAGAGVVAQTHFAGEASPLQHHPECSRRLRKHLRRQQKLRPPSPLGAALRGCCAAVRSAADCAQQ